MTPQQLRNSIFQLAIEGKLVEQRTEEGSGEELLQLIQEQKKELIEAGKLKKTKALSEITETEIPFEIPTTWKWVRWGDIIEVISSKRVLQSDWKKSGIPFYRAREISKLSETGYVDNELFIDNALYHTLSKYGVPNEGDLMVSAVGTLGKTYIVKKTDKFYYKDASVLCLRNYAKLNSLFLKYIMESLLMKNQIKGNSTGTTVSTLTIVRMSNYIIPLPPLGEQNRIVKKIEKLLLLSERYAVAWNKLENLSRKFPEDLQKSILQEAIQGKLCKQKYEDGFAESLVKAISLEREHLIESGQIKKQKELAPIQEDEIPFDIPKNWIWSRFGDLGSYRKGPFGSALTKNLFVPKSDDTVKVYEQKNAIKKDATLGEYYITKEYYEEKMLAFTVIPGDIIVSCAGTIGETFILPEDSERGIINQALMRMRLFKPIYTKYFLLYFDFILKQNVRKNSKGSAIKNIPPFSILKNYLVPLPPVAEQKRIVETVHQFLLLLEQYQSGIE